VGHHHRARYAGGLAHPDDESLGFGGTLAKYAAAGVDVSLVTATRGAAGRYRGNSPGTPAHPGAPALARIREGELRDAAAVLGLSDVALLEYGDQLLDRAEPARVTAEIATHVRRVRPDVVVTFGPDGAYGHPDHVAISQFTTAAIVAAASPFMAIDGAPHQVSKLYYMAWPASTWMAMETALRRLAPVVDGQERRAVAWPEWAITTVLDTRAVWPIVWRAISCHASQVSAYQKLADLSPAHHEALWGRQSYYRAFSAVNGCRALETDLFEGLA
jgi:LmbE family N-acetylglucosaminyl deacetylase